MRLYNFLVERYEHSQKGFGITFIDIDETTFNTFAKILVKKNGKIVRELDNQQFNSDVLSDGEEYDFGQFRSADLFKRTSLPIIKTVNMIKNMIKNIKKNESSSKIIFLTARSDFDDKQTFLDTFRAYGIDVDFPNVYIERTGNMSTGTVDERKKKVMMEYIKTGIYRRVRLVDDHLPNLKALTDIEKNIPIDVVQKVRDTYNLPINDPVPAIQFFALHVDSSGNLKRIN